MSAALEELLARKRALDKKVREVELLAGGRRPESIEEHRGRALKRKRETSAQIRDIGPPPDISDYALRLKVHDDLEAFYREIFGDLFHWPFSRDQQRAIGRHQEVADHGGLVLDAEPRGSGKTQRALRFALWAILTGRRKYVPIICATTRLSKNALKSLKTIVRHTPLLLKLYPAELHGFAQLGTHNRAAAGQLCQGQETGIGLGTDQIVFPKIPGSDASESVMSAWGITGSVRGQFHTRLDGTVIRPDMPLLDDPQTKESARSGAQTQERFEIINSDVLGLSGPQTRIACCAQVTVIEKNDLSERLLRDPRWQGERCRMILNFPTNMSAWDAYFEKFRELERLGQIDQINDAYYADREALDAGGRVAWEHRIAAGDISALQTAMHKWHEMGPAAFAAECQNEPIDESAESDAPSFRGLDLKFTGLARGIVPKWASWITVGIDVQKLLLMFVVCAWSPYFDGSIIDYGAWPKQSRSFYIRREAFPTLQSESKSSQDEGAWYFGLTKITEELFGRRWQQEGGGELTLSKAIIDANGDASETVNEFCRRSPFRSSILPSYGRGIKAGNLPMDQYPKKTGEQLGFHWLIRQSKTQAIRHLVHDVNFWKTFLARRSMALAGERGSLSVFGTAPEQHHMLLAHLQAESAQRTFGRGREVWEWTIRAGEENDFLDGLVMAGSAASICGASLETLSAVKTNQRKTVTIPSRLLKRGGP